MITNTIGPFGIQFFNVNREMKLAGHGHYAVVKFTYQAREPGGRVFPAFEGTYKDVQDELRSFFKEPFRDHTNEDIARALFAHFSTWTTEGIKGWGGDYDLVRVDLGVQGVLDRIGHADGMTWYTVT